MTLPYLSKLPARIDPCPIVDAYAELRFQTDVPPTTFPGLIFAVTRERFPIQRDLPLASLPDAIRVSDPSLRYSPTVEFCGDGWALMVGPQVLNLHHPNGYPGWAKYREMLEWLFGRFKDLGFVRTPERLGLRYTDFFELPIGDKLKVNLTVGDAPAIDLPFHISCQLQRPPFGCLLQLNSSSILSRGEKPEHGAILDIDVSAPLKPETSPEVFFDGVLKVFDAAHLLQKRLFFQELLRPEFLATHKVSYE